MKIVFHGQNARMFRPGFEELLTGRHEILEVGDAVDQPGERDAFATADVLIGVRFTDTLPRPERLRLYHAPAAGTDAIDTAALPEGVALCNCFGHENAIAEYVMAALLARHVPLADADARLRRGDWRYWSGSPNGPRTELGGTTVGLLGFGHIGRTIAERAHAFGMGVTVANRSPVPVSALVDRSFTFDALEEFMGSADAIVVSLPLVPETTGIVDSRLLAAMRPDAVILNVGRGPVIDEGALYAALKDRRIGGAVIDTWYVYPGEGRPTPNPSSLPFHELDNIVMTPHMSGWTAGTIRRRQETMAGNINRLMAGDALVNRLL
ncbi:phosphoglycerate dehydrogenase [Azospirillum sp. RWY-5-1]|uniref:Phosphoglycerate dehydrogenase n=1 Tax=Azospirillum oleiclasticum TaxID=2735135 RepID=A0ABX2TFB9_9PROT|nr:2-hydroxyacid dehydrogenase [Azospirillum oleiclasticum]NYZ16082.1 phosphoglycerate dehydrogenase [Azospirillum oleiclasticum]NYZ22963.1 phosphoglycerate dehydrogenase [Azospirillum oleiclasticum]